MEYPKMPWKKICGYLAIAAASMIMFNFFTPKNPLWFWMICFCAMMVCCYVCGRQIGNLLVERLKKIEELQTKEFNSMLEDLEETMKG